MQGSLFFLWNTSLAVPPHFRAKLHHGIVLFLAHSQEQEHKRITDCTWKETKDLSVFGWRTTDIKMSNKWDINNWELLWHGQKKGYHKVLSDRQRGQRKTTAAKGLGSTIYEHVHTNNKPRRQTNPLTTRCDTTKTGSSLWPCRGQRSWSNHCDTSVHPSVK